MIDSVGLMKLAQPTSWGDFVKLQDWRGDEIIDT